MTQKVTPTATIERTVACGADDAGTAFQSIRANGLDFNVAVQGSGDRLALCCRIDRCRILADMIDHTGVGVSDFDRSKEFYRKALAAIGYELIAEFSAEVTGSTAVAGFGEPPKPDFWINAGVPNKPAVHVAFRVPTRRLVDQFYSAAIAAGGMDNGGPGPRPHYHANYYGAFVLDPDGHNVEAVCHEHEAA